LKQGLYNRGDPHSIRKSKPCGGGKEEGGFERHEQRGERNWGVMEGFGSNTMTSTEQFLG